MEETTKYILHLYRGSPESFLIDLVYYHCHCQFIHFPYKSNIDRHNRLICVYENRFCRFLPSYRPI